MKPEELDLLRKYFPENAVEGVAALFNDRKFVLQFKSPRLTKLGDFRPPRNKTGLCHITLNCDLHPYQMLITFVHEVAHFDVYQQYKNSVLPHGEEWKTTYAKLLLPFINEAVFPNELIGTLHRHLTHIKASSSADTELLKALRRYETTPSAITTVENLPEGARFRLKNGLVFEKGAKQRTRYKCFCLTDGRWYAVSALAEVES